MSRGMDAAERRAAGRGWSPRRRAGGARRGRGTDSEGRREGVNREGRCTEGVKQMERGMGNTEQG